MKCPNCDEGSIILCDVCDRDRWIKVEDRLPPQNVYVLVAKFDHRPKVNMYFVSIAERIGERWFDGKDGDEVTSGGKYGRVTHWMAVPDKPKLEDDEGSK